MADLLSRITETECCRLCHHVVDGLCGRSLPCREDFKATFTPQEWLQLLDFLRNLFRRAGDDLSVEHEALLQMAGIQNAETILRVMKGRQEEIRRALQDRTDAISTSTLQDFHWMLKLALSSDKISSLNVPLLSLQLDVNESGNVRPVSIEMDRDELNAVISNLEAANKVVLQLK